MVPFGQVPKVTIRLVVQAANLHEGREEVWLADLTGDMMSEGTTTLTADALAREFASMGGELGVGVGPDTASISTEVLSDHGVKAVQLVADVATRPLLPAAELDRVKANLLRNLALRKSSPQAVAQEKFSELMFGDHPYGRIFPTEAMLKGYTLDQVKAFHKEHFVAGRARLYVAGVFDASAMEAAFAKRSNRGRVALGGKPPALPRRQVRRLRADRSRRSTTVDGAARSAGAGSVKRRLDRARGRRLAARRLVCLANHVEHPRAEGLHLFAIQQSRSRIPGWRAGTKARM